MSESPAGAVSFTIPVQRVASAASTFLRRGIDPREVLAQAGIAGELLHLEHARVTSEQLTKVLDQLWSRTGDELLGLGRAPVPLGSFRLLVHGTQSAPDLGRQLERFRRLQTSVPGFPELVVESDPATGRTQLSLDIDYVRRPVEIIIDTMLMLARGYLSWLISAPLDLREVHVPYGPIVDRADHQRLFDAPVIYHARRPAFVFDSALLRRATDRGERDADVFLRDAPVRMLGRRDYGSSLADQLRLRIAARVPGEAIPSVDQLASELAMSPQTLRRRLSEEGVSPRAIRDEVLRDIAIAGLVRGDSVQSLSRTLGFSEPSTFSRAFRRWTGSPPGLYQRARS